MYTSVSIILEIQIQFIKKSNKKIAIISRGLCMSKCRGPPFLCSKTEKRVKKGGSKDVR